MVITNPIQNQNNHIYENPLKRKAHEAGFSQGGRNIGPEVLTTDFYETIYYDVNCPVVQQIKTLFSQALIYFRLYPDLAQSALIQAKKLAPKMPLIHIFEEALKKRIVEDKLLFRIDRFINFGIDVTYMLGSIEDIHYRVKFAQAKVEFYNDNPKKRINL